ncbi:MTRF1L release factor glutamine methyltransferase-like [Saccoglossus kowalevskii]
MPLQYVLGEWDFRDLTLKLRPPVFIPRPETEELVEMILQYHRPRINLHFLEVGCGSGAISLSLLHEIPQAIGIAIDQSHAAVKLTEHNATRLNLHDRLTVHNIEVVDSFKIPNDIAGPYDAIISNPPYIFHDDMKDLAPEISRYEDTKALHGGHDGLEVTKNILKMARYLLKHEGSIWFECDPRHPTMIKSWLDNHPETDVKFVDVGYDFSDRARFCHLKYIPTKVKT